MSDYYEQAKIEIQYKSEKALILASLWRIAEALEKLSSNVVTTKQEDSTNE